MLQKKEQVYEALRRVDQALAELLPEALKIELILIGGAAVIVRHGGKRWTADIDALDKSRRLWGLGLLEEYGLHLVSEALLNLHPDYEKRLEKAQEPAGLKKLAVWLLGPYDLAITKIGRGLTHDYEDLASSGLAGEINLARLIKLSARGSPDWQSKSKSTAAERKGSNTVLKSSACKRKILFLSLLTRAGT